MDLIVKIQKLLKSIQLSPFLLFAAVFFFLALGSILLPQHKNNKDNKIAKQTVQPTIAQNPTETPAVQGIWVTVTPLPIHISSPTTDSNTSTRQSPSTQQSIHMQISEPDGTFNFSLPVKSNECDELTEAKNKGKIRSVTFSNQWMSSMGSLYIVEINGYHSNWTFNVNGTQPPVGCSKSYPKSNDSVVWKFG